MAYATVSDIESRLPSGLSDEQRAVCEHLLEDAAVIIDAYNAKASADNKRVVSCRMVIRAVGDLSDAGVPVGASQGTISALGYSQTWTMSTGNTAGELYLAKLDKKLLGVSDRIGSYSPVQSLVGGIND